MRMRLVAPVVLMFLTASCALAQSTQLIDAYPEKARFAASEPVNLVVDLSGSFDSTAKLSATVWRLGTAVGECQPMQPASQTASRQILRCSLPSQDFQGYLVTVRLADASGHSLGERQTAIDVSSDWKRFPRYGYLAHYNSDEGTKPDLWMNELNRFHINGLEFYDFQYRHDQPLAGTVEHPEPSWKDIAARTIDAHTVTSLIDQAHRYNMMAMAYNASYSSYDDVFSRTQDPLPLTWATWKTPDVERTPATAKNLHLQATSWSTKFLFYMNQNSLEWQNYIFGQMHELFQVYPFDGWHIDTFGDTGGYAFDGTYVDYIAGLRPFVDHASAALRRPVVINAVNTSGQEFIARSAAQFVYSELWEDHETFTSILATTEQVHLANPRVGFVIAAYVNRRDAQDRAKLPIKQFNPNAVLLTDAAIFASGASHIELGDGDRMLSSEYFPADLCTTVSPALRDSLRHYYDYLTAYENYLRDEVTPATAAVKVSGQTADPLAVPNTLWTIARQKGDSTMVHFINLLGSEDPHWRDLDFNRPEPPLLRNLQVEIAAPENVRTAGWASPDVDGGQFHSIPFTILKDGKITWIQLTLPQLHYWDTVFLSQ
jgi:dextranase